MDFDFLVGTNHVANRRLNRDSGQWEEFPGRNEGAAYLDGQVVVDELRATLPDGREIAFVDVHAYDPVSGVWSNVVHGKGAPPDWAPMSGRFQDGVGEFAQVNGLIRHTWDRITPVSARFRQAVSADGVTWEVDWVMDLTRI
ncbi:MAG TPA: hypothetical protein VM677_26575 [Actinokineospora sp.]|jgi:hypothetical protein|nr:hypothetical protein [Actinokineospora sp.]